MEGVKVIDNIKNHALNRVEKMLRKLSVREQQFYINELIRYYDILYDSTINNTSSKETLNFIDFSFPVILRYLYNEYSNIEGSPLGPSSIQTIKSIELLLHISYKAGVLENYGELLKRGILKCDIIGEKKVQLSYINKHHSIERYERTKSVIYSHNMMSSLESEYYKKFSELPSIIKKMEKLVYTWENNFIGYDADPKIDSFYLQNAQLDFVQATEWDGFSPTSEFGGIEYHLFLEALIAIESISIKHLQFVEIATKKDPNLVKHNILPCVVDYKDLVNSLTYILTDSEETIERLLSTLILDEEKKEFYTHIGAPLPPFLRISSTQLLRSFCGSVYRPIDFMLSELKRQYPKDWDRNTREREALFRRDLYQLFLSDQFLTYDRSIDIVENGKIVTDIDACIVDKVTKEIAFIQLKWQDSIYDSTKSLVSKSKNYNEKANKWVKDIQLWIETATEKRIADFLQLSPQFVAKEKIKIFVIGRHNGNYSADEMPCRSVAWCQWYNLVELFREHIEKRLTIAELFDLIQRESPYNQDNELQTSELKYGNYRVELIAPLYNQA